jgi:type IV pilus assembly protein PilE
MRKYSAKGFTLMEVMIAVVIVGILAGIAYPNYINYVRETRRTDASINLTRIARLQVSFFTRCGRYAANLGVSQTIPDCATGTMDADLEPGGLARGGLYTLTSVVTPGPPPLLAPGGGTFILTATPNPTKVPAAEIAKCATLTITETGVKGATGTDAVLSPFGGRCWKR